MPNSALRNALVRVDMCRLLGRGGEDCKRVKEYLAIFKNEFGFSIKNLLDWAASSSMSKTRVSYVFSKAMTPLCS
ncbi:MAG: hypothetical protein QXY11_03230 [Desulfurococcaceae archaeon]